MIHRLYTAIDPWWHHTGLMMHSYNGLYVCIKIYSKDMTGLRNPREHGSAAPRKKYGWQKKLEEYLKKNHQRKNRGDSECWFCSLLWYKAGSFRELCPWTPAKDLASRPRLCDKPHKDGIPPSQFCTFLWNLFLSYFLKTNKVKYIKNAFFIGREFYKKSSDFWLKLHFWEIDKKGVFVPILF